MADSSLPPSESAETRTKAFLFQDGDGNLHISSSANHSVYVNNVNMPERIRQLQEEVTAANTLIASQQEQISAASSERAALLFQLRAVNSTAERRLSALEAFVGIAPGSFPNSPSFQTTTPAAPHTTLPPVYPLNNGTLAWTSTFGSRNIERSYGIVVDSSSFVYVTGQTSAGNAANPIYHFDGQAGAGDWDGFVLRCMPDDGKSLWTRLFGTSNAEYSFAIASDSTNDIFVAAWVSSGLDGNTFYGQYDIALLKYNNNGVRKWTRQIGGTGQDFPSAIAVDNDDFVIAAGYTNGGVAGNTNAGGFDILLAKYDGEGVQVWLKQFGSTGSDKPLGVAVDRSNNILVTGSTTGRLVEDTEVGLTGSYDLFVAKYDANGSSLWTRQIGSDEWDECTGIAVDDVGNAYVVCQSSGDLNGVLNVGLNDVFVMKFDTDGAKLWSRRLATTADDKAMAVAVDSNNFVYVAGTTKGGLEGNVKSSTSVVDNFLAQYDSDGSLRWFRQYQGDDDNVGHALAVDKKNNQVYVVGGTYNVIVKKFV